jgi:hypothetical protein
VYAENNSILLFLISEVNLFILLLEPEKGIKSQIRERRLQKLLVAEETKKGTVS